MFHNLKRFDAHFVSHVVKKPTIKKVSLSTNTSHDMTKTNCTVVHTAHYMTKFDHNRIYEVRAKGKDIYTVPFCV